MPVKKQTKNKLEKEKQIHEYIGIGVMIVVSVLLYKYIMLPWFPDVLYVAYCFINDVSELFLFYLQSLDRQKLSF